MDLTIWGDFNCPFSALASLRAAQLEQVGAARIDWRAIPHDLEIPAAGEIPDPEAAAEYAAELDQVRGLLLPDEQLVLRIPTVRASTVAASEAYAALAPEERASSRTALFRAYWEEGRNIGDRHVLDALGLDASAPETVAEWRAEWLAVDRHVVPLLRLADGYISRGLGALARLGDLVAAAQP